MTSSRPVLLVSNSSWYLIHYRNLLLRRLKQEGNHVVALAPVDSSSPELSRLLIHIPWRIHRIMTQVPCLFVFPFCDCFLVRAIKPKLVHSHTLKANLLTALVTAFLGFPVYFHLPVWGDCQKLRASLVFSLCLFCVVSVSLPCVSDLLAGDGVFPLNVHPLFSKIQSIVPFLRMHCRHFALVTIS